MDKHIFISGHTRDSWVKCTKYAWNTENKEYDFEGVTVVVQNTGNGYTFTKFPIATYLELDSDGSKAKELSVIQFNKIKNHAKKIVKSQDRIFSLTHPEYETSK